MPASEVFMVGSKVLTDERTILYQTVHLLVEEMFPKVVCSVVIDIVSGMFCSTFLYLHQITIDAPVQEAHTASKVQKRYLLHYRHAM